MEQKKIVFYTDTPIYGGAERIMLELARNLPVERYQVQLVCSHYKELNEWCEKWKETGLKVSRLAVAHKHDPRHLTGLKKILKKENPALLHIHLWNPGACRYAFSAVDKSKTKIVTTEHDPFELNGIKKMLKKKAIKKTDLTITVSHANQDMLMHQYPELKGKIITVPNGIDLDAFEKSLIHFSSQKKQKVRQQIMGVENDDFVILSVAALHPRKGLKYLIEGMKTVREKKANAHLVIVGEGPQRKELENLIKKLELESIVHLRGKQNDISTIFKSSDLFVLPSTKEAFGLVLLEAMAAQVPVITSNVGGIPEIIKDGKSGVLVEPGKPDELATAILELMGNSPLREKLGFVGHHEAKNFDIRIMAEKTAELYDRLLQ